jgi:hypothetical protein
MKQAALLLSLALVLAACGSGGHDSSTTAGTRAPDTAGAAKLVLPFRADDYAGALQEARQRNLPIFIETWAPW